MLRRVEGVDGLVVNRQSPALAYLIHSSEYSANNHSSFARRDERERERETMVSNDPFIRSVMYYVTDRPTDRRWTFSFDSIVA